MGTTTLTETEVLDIYDKASRGETYAYLAEEYGMSASAIRDICQGKTWRHLELPPLPPRRTSGAGEIVTWRELEQPEETIYELYRELQNYNHHYERSEEDNLFLEEPLIPGDTFRFGFCEGKLAVLKWLFGIGNDADTLFAVKADMTFEHWERELQRKCEDR